MHRFNIREGLCNVVDIIDDKKCCSHKALIELLKLLGRNRSQNPMCDDKERIIVTDGTDGVLIATTSAPFVSVRREISIVLSRYKRKSRIGAVT